MRMTQNMGLPPAADAFLKRECLRALNHECPTCHHKTGGEMVCEVYEDASEQGMFDDGPQLRKYTLNGGSTVKEVVQCTPWDCGPMIYLCLKDDYGNTLFQWPKEETGMEEEE